MQESPPRPRPAQTSASALSDVSSFQLPGAIRDFLSLSTQVSWGLRGEVNTIWDPPHPSPCLSVSVCFSPLHPNRAIKPSYFLRTFL